MPYIETDGSKLYFDIYDLTGPWVEKPETILFHHGIGTNSDIWTDWIPVLADRYRIVRFDFRGFGRSSVPKAGVGWTMDSLVADLFEIANTTESERSHFVGESMGGTIGLFAMLKRPTAFLTVTVSKAYQRNGEPQCVRGAYCASFARLARGGMYEPLTPSSAPATCLSGHVRFPGRL